MLMVCSNSFWLDQGIREDNRRICRSSPHTRAKKGSVTMITSDCPCVQKAHRDDDDRLHLSEHSTIDPIPLDLLSLKSVSALGEALKWHKDTLRICATLDSGADRYSNTRATIVKKRGPHRAIEPSNTLLPRSLVTDLNDPTFASSA